MMHLLKTHGQRGLLALLTLGVICAAEAKLAAGESGAKESSQSKPTAAARAIAERKVSEGMACLLENDERGFYAALAEAEAADPTYPTTYFARIIYVAEKEPVEPFIEALNKLAKRGLVSQHRLAVLPRAEHWLEEPRVTARLQEIIGPKKLAELQWETGLASAKPRLGQPHTIPLQRVQMAWIPPGTFTMGGTREKNETPHQVTLTQGFWLGAKEITQGQYEEIMGENPSLGRWKKDGVENPKNTRRLPVENLPWDQVMKFCEKLTERERAAGRLAEGQFFTLPTEAQWEYACRAGSTGDYAGDLDKMAWYEKTSNGLVQVTGQRQPNAWGLYDMHGNVGEWCLDNKIYVPYAPEPVTDPAGAASSFARVVRGGHYRAPAHRQRSAYRDSLGANSHDPTVGFRLALVQTRGK